MIGQIQVLDLADVQKSRQELLHHQTELLAEADSVDPVLKGLGGGARNLEVRVIEASPIGAFLVVHLLYDVRDAMGANAVNTACERLAPRIEAITGGRVHLRILSNLADHRLPRRVRSVKGWHSAIFGREGPGRSCRGLGCGADPIAATHNKGIMNGVDAVVIATGNDWRAVEAGACVAARSGRYTSLNVGKNRAATWLGRSEMPMCRHVRGATKVHPMAQFLRPGGIRRQVGADHHVVGLAQHGSPESASTEDQRAI
jgi:hydroxymethylglutaryl-CoA reductase